MNIINKNFKKDKKIYPYFTILIISSLILIFDQLTKFLVVHIFDLSNRLVITVIPGFIYFKMAWNEGINFGLFANSSNLMRISLIVISIIISLGIFFWALKQKRFLLLVFSSLIIGGALGNVVDRIIYGAVADFLNITCCGIYNPFSFNIADISIFFGVLGIIFAPTGENQNKNINEM